MEVCYCREYYGVAMHEELPYLEEYLTDIVVADARNPAHCEGSPECNDCACTRKVWFEGEPLLDHLRRLVASGGGAGMVIGRSIRWTGWRGQVGPEEARLNRAGEIDRRG